VRQLDLGCADSNDSANTWHASLAAAERAKEVMAEVLGETSGRLEVAERERDEARQEIEIADREETELLEHFKRAEARAERLAGALREIANDPHCSYDHPTISRDSYGTGVVDGHRCAGSKASAALSPEARPPDALDTAPAQPEGRRA
jgi:hypothetical protein